MYDHVKTRAFLKVLLFNSFPLQNDKEMCNNLAKFYLCTFLSPDTKCGYCHFISVSLHY